MNCNNCGNIIQPHETFCAACGTTIQNQPNMGMQPPQQNMGMPQQQMPDLMSPPQQQPDMGMQPPPVTTMQPTGMPMPDAVQPQPNMGVQPPPPQQNMGMPMPGPVTPMQPQPGMPGMGMPQQQMGMQQPMMAGAKKPFPVAVIAILIATVAIVICLFVFFRGGSGNSLTCTGTLDEVGFTGEEKVEFSFSGNELSKISSTTTIEDLDSDVISLIELGCGMYNSFDGFSCNTNVSGRTVSMTVTINVKDVDSREFEDFMRASYEIRGEMTRGDIKNHFNSVSNWTCK